ncbi:hypothetical protein HPB52_007998 [Rhipicephalus sanguineus]|uniref:Tick transposon n=1 Tax=Rhipicephalus sanguineus TaxID=34632 RepID=A0A9D4SVU2_RHISA|nr:hypothetical protein HPB52_007998 [Rhipicephalus sanguineus]
MASPIPLPLFLSSPGDPPIPWSDWKLIFQAYADAAGEDATKPKRRKALLLNALGHAERKLFYTLNAANAGHFKDASCDYIARLKLQERRQFPGEPVVDFITSLRTLAASCGFSALENDMLRHQLFTGIASQNVHCRLLQKGASISLSEAIAIAREDELLRSQLEHSFELRGPKAAVLCFTGCVNMAALLRLGAAVNMAAPPLRGGKEAVKMAAQIRLFKGNRECLAHFSNFRRRFPIHIASDAVLFSI